MITSPGLRRSDPAGGRDRAGSGSGGQRGAATAELAMVLPLLVAITIGLVWLLAVGAAQIRTVDAARETARSLARGDDPSVATALGRQVAPGGATVAVITGADQVTVTVTARIDGPGGLFRRLGSARVRATAVAAVEDGG